MATWDSFLLSTSDDLLTEFSGLYQLVHNTDLSDNDQDFVLYLGSLTANRQLQTTTNPGVDNIELDIVDLLTNWTTGTSFSVGDSVQPSSGNENGYRYVCTVAGTSDGSTEPTWPTSGIGTTVSDNDITWEFVGAKHEETEIKLATSSAGLDSATGGVTLSLGNTIDSLVGNLVEIHMRVTNAVTNVSNNTGSPELGLSFNSVTETATVPS
jgi:hypothetical protein